VLPERTEFQKSAPWLRFANRCFEQEGGEETALTVIERALVTSPEADRAAVAAHRIRLLERWSHHLLEKQEFTEALKVLARALQLEPDNQHVHGSIAYHIQEALGDLDADGTKTTAAVAHYRAVSTQFPTVKAVGEAGFAHVERLLDRMCEQQKFKEALAVAVDYAPVAGSVEKAQRLTVQIYCEWGAHLREQKRWKESIEKHLEGLKLVPQDSRLVNGALQTIDSWADLAMTSKDWDAAIKVYDQGLTYLPDDRHLKNNREYCVAKKSEAK